MKIAVVLVTYNRCEKLKIALNKYSNQERKPDFMVIVNNASSDGTVEFLQGWKALYDGIDKRIITTNTNLGGSGGYYVGIEYALKLKCDFMFLADDDAFADSKMLLELEGHYLKLLKSRNIAALCTKNINDGEIDTMHRRIIYRGLLNVTSKWINEAEYKKDYFNVDELSFVGAFIKSDIVLEIGLPRRDYFIYFDDSEYSARIRKKGDIYCIPSSIMFHDSAKPDGTFNWKTYYTVRNSLDCIKQHNPKRYYYFAILKHYIKEVSFVSRLKRRTHSERAMCKKAISDSLHDRFGVDNTYKPGYKVNQ